MPFVNWQRVNAMYCGVMWMIALVLAVVILVHGLPDNGVQAHHAVAVVVR